eukprot:6672555-Pyramimonas_sp.AAC.1
MPPWPVMCSHTASGSGGGWVLYGAQDIVYDDPSEWVRVADMSFVFDSRATVTAAELEAALWCVLYFCARISGRDELTHFLDTHTTPDFAIFPVLEILGMC